MDYLIGIGIVLAAYFLKGFSGFGPALVMIPLMSIVYDPFTAIILTVFLDFLAGVFLMLSVRRDIIWTFVTPVFIALALGAIIGASLLEIISTGLLKRIIGLSIIVFALIIFFDRERQKPQHTHSSPSPWRYFVGFISGVLGGLLSISGPPLVIYMKWNFDKSFFRTQLIGIFMLGAAWRLMLYRMYDMPVNLSLTEIVLFTATMFVALIIGNRIHLAVNELTFNRVIACLIIVPAVRLFLLA